MRAIKVGDLVQALNTTYWQDYRNQNRVGDKFVVWKISKDTHGCKYYHIDKDSTDNCCIEDIQLIEQSEEMIFQNVISQVVRELKMK